MQFQINYTRQFGKHNVGGMLMYMQRDFKKDVLPNRNQGFSGRLHMIMVSAIYSNSTLVTTAQSVWQKVTGSSFFRLLL